ncbi:MAG: tryptophan synthase subunit alpha [Acidimicrobiales bacterium]|jgi:tryptophan synthase alpha chain|nr:tryptophan synthase subunit alpha [Actinomycetota bacterium]
MKDEFDSLAGGSSSGDQGGRELGELEESLRSRCSEGKKLLIPYVTAGMCAEWVEIVLALEAGGADAIEIGIPFSDPMMDGPVIQRASAKALLRGTTPVGVLGELARASLSVPVVVMTYYNLVLHMGHYRMAHELRAAGVSGVIIADLPLEELGPWSSESDGLGIATVLMVAPTTTPQRAAAICKRSQGFVYCVSRMGVTGEQGTLGSAAASLAKRIKGLTDMPVCIGIGVSSAKQAVEACQEADGVVVGSSLVRRVLEGEGTAGVEAFIGEMRRALDSI